VAAETGWPLDKVTRYAEPLLGERAYVAEQASAVEISRSRGGATLHQSVCVKVDVDPDTDSVSWDSYRNPEGRWVVTAFHDGAAIGTWLYEEAGRTVHPQDESARALMGGGPTVVADSAPVSRSDASPADISDEGTAEAAEAADDESAPAPPSSKTERPRLVSVTSDPTVEKIDEASTPQPTDGSGEPGEAADSGETALFETTDTPQREQGEPAKAPATKRAKRAKGKRGRASVPSWDEILFGASKGDE
jgi:Protein of unknown function (DUF3071).